MVIDYLSYEEKKMGSQKLGSQELGSQKLGPQSPSLRLGAAVDTDWYQHGHQVILTHSKGLCRQKSDKTNALAHELECCLLYTSPSPRDATLSRMPSSA